MLVHSMLNMFMNSDSNIKMFVKYGVMMVIDEENYRNISHQIICIILK